VGVLFSIRSSIDHNLYRAAFLRYWALQFTIPVDLDVTIWPSLAGTYDPYCALETHRSRSAIGAQTPSIVASVTHLVSDVPRSVAIKNKRRGPVWNSSIR